METKKSLLLALTLTAMGLAGCAPAKHTTTSMSNRAVAGFAAFGEPVGEDFEFPAFEDENSEDELPPLEPIEQLNSEGRRPAAWDGRTPDAAKFTEITERAIDELGPQLLESVPRDIETFCPNYARLGAEERKGVWLMMVSAIAKFESNFRPSVSYRENFVNSKGELIVSRGLLQLSSESANGFGCRIRQESDLHDPEKNLTCGVRILTRTITRDGIVTEKTAEHWKGGARYWSVLRKQRTLPAIKGATRGLASCN